MSRRQDIQTSWLDELYHSGFYSMSPRFQSLGVPQAGSCPSPRPPFRCSTNAQFCVRASHVYFVFMIGGTIRWWVSVVFIAYVTIFILQQTSDRNNHTSVPHPGCLIILTIHCSLFIMTLGRFKVDGNAASPIQLQHCLVQSRRATQVQCSTHPEAVCSDTITI